MKILYYIIVIFLLSCQSSMEESGLEIELTNKEVFFIQTEEPERYKNDADRKLSYTLLSVKFKNNSDKKLLIFLNPQELNFEEKSEYFSHKCVIENVGIKQGVLSTFLNYPEGLNSIEQYNESLKNVKYNSLGLSAIEKKLYSLYEEYSVVLGPNEIKTVYFSLNLPIIKEFEPHILQDAIRYGDLEEGLNFKFIYEIRADVIRQNLPNFLKEELEANKVEIFEGCIYSNSVKLKKRE